jgi:hypothetical protein
MSNLVENIIIERIDTINNLLSHKQISRRYYDEAVVQLLSGLLALERE